MDLDAVHPRTQRRRRHVGDAHGGGADDRHLIGQRIGLDFALENRRRGNPPGRVGRRKIKPQATVAVSRNEGVADLHAEHAVPVAAHDILFLARGDAQDFQSQHWGRRAANRDHQRHGADRAVAVPRIVGITAPHGRGFDLRNVGKLRGKRLEIRQRRFAGDDHRGLLGGSRVLGFAVDERCARDHRWNLAQGLRQNGVVGR